MMSDIYFGKIKPEKNSNWGKNKNPFEILEQNTRIERLGGWEFLSIHSLMRDKVQVDWGSFAYRCGKKELSELISKTKCIVPGYDDLDEEQEYGVVFVELN